MATPRRRQTRRGSRCSPRRTRSTRRAPLPGRFTPGCAPTVLRHGQDPVRRDERSVPRRGAVLRPVLRRVEGDHRRAHLGRAALQNRRRAAADPRQEGGPLHGEALLPAGRVRRVIARGPRFARSPHQGESPWRGILNPIGIPRGIASGDRGRDRSRCVRTRRCPRCSRRSCLRDGHASAPTPLTSSWEERAPHGIDNERSRPSWGSVS